jgi:hypothetical protein
MVTFAFLGNTLFLTILVSMLSNTFSTIATNATAEIQFRRAVLTLEGVKSDAIFAYLPPFNIVALALFLPLKYLVSPRWFHKIHVTTVRTINMPLLFIIAIAERRTLWSDASDAKKLDPEAPGERRLEPRTKQRFWEKWRITAHRDIRAVFDLPPPDSVGEDIAVDDELTHHLIRKQFTRHNTSDSLKKRRDSTFAAQPSGPQKKKRASFTETDDMQDIVNRMDAMEATTAWRTVGSRTLGWGRAVRSGIWTSRRTNRWICEEDDSLLDRVASQFAFGTTVRNE